MEAPNRLMRVCWAVQGIIMDTLYQGLGFRAFPNIQFWNQVFVSLAYLLIVIVKCILHDGLLYMLYYLSSKWDERVKGWNRMNLRSHFLWVFSLIA